MKKCEVTAYYSDDIIVEIDDNEGENEAIRKAQMELKDINTTLIADYYEVVEIEDED